MRYAPLARSSHTHAMAWVGRHWPPGWCLAWVLRHVYGLPTNIESAHDYLHDARHAGVLQHAPGDQPIPAGALVLWTGDPGHVAYSLGDGTVVTTDLPHAGQVGIVPISDVAELWGIELAGYVLTTPEGIELTREPAPEPQLRFISTPQLVGTPVTVTGDRVQRLDGTPVEHEVGLSKKDPTGRARIVRSSGATLYSGPLAESAAIVAHLAAGDVVTVLDQATVDGTSWLRLSGGRFVQAKEVRKP